MLRKNSGPVTAITPSVLSQHDLRAVGVPIAVPPKFLCNILGMGR